MEDVASMKHTCMLEDKVVNATAFCNTVSKPLQELGRFANNELMMTRSFPR